MSFLDLVFSRVLIFCAYTRPRYQVSVDRTIGPLVVFIVVFSRPIYQASIYRTIGPMV